MKTAFIDLNFHLEQTKSSQFFIDLCRQHFDDFHLVGANEAWYTIPRLKPDTLILWQSMFQPEEIDSWQAKNVILIPMMDDVQLTDAYWNKYKPYKVFCFCKKLYDFLNERGFSVFYSQYYMEPHFHKATENKPDVFFWERSSLINWQLVKKLLNGTDVASLHYHYATNISDKNNDRPTQDDIGKYNITFSDWFESQDEYTQLLHKTDLYIAPREKEGIGLSFIEALAEGCVVAAYNDATMNEYITDGADGFLFTEQNAKPFVLKSVAFCRLQEASHKRAENGWETWNKNIPQLFAFFDTPMSNYSPQKAPGIYIFKRIRSEIRHIYKKLCRHR